MRKGMERKVFSRGKKVIKDIIEAKGILGETPAAQKEIWKKKNGARG